MLRTFVIEGGTEHVKSPKKVKTVRFVGVTESAEPHDKPEVPNGLTQSKNQATGANAEPIESTTFEDSATRADAANQDGSNGSATSSNPAGSIQPEIAPVLDPAVSNYGVHRLNTN